MSATPNSGNNPDGILQFLIEQLKRAEARNALVDGQRFSLLQMFFGFETVMLGAALLTRGEGRTIRDQLGAGSQVVPVLALVVGLSLFGAFIRQHITMRGYKNWIADIEGALRSMMFPAESTVAKKTTLYHRPGNEPLLDPDATLLAALFAMTALNLGVVLLLLTVVQAESTVTGTVLSGGIALHLGVIVYFWHRYRHIAPTPDIHSPKATRNEESPDAFEERGPNRVDQWRALGDDLRFYADQRFKVLGAFMVANGLLANVAKDQRSLVLAAVGVLLAYFCLSWERWTAKWWGILFEGLKNLEKGALDRHNMDRIYALYPRSNRSMFPRASLAVRSIYYLGLAAWLAFGIYSWPIGWGAAPR